MASSEVSTSPLMVLAGSVRGVSGVQRERPLGRNVADGTPAHSSKKDDNIRCKYRELVQLDSY